MQPSKTRKVAYLSSILFLLVILLSACGSQSNSVGNSLTPASPDKQVLRLAVEGGDFDTLDPALTYSGLGYPYNILYSGIMTLNDDGTVSPQLASSYQVSPDGLTYTFTLRSGVKFSDGTPIDANAVAYSLNRVLEPATKSPVVGYLSSLKDYDKITGGQIPTLINDSIIVKDSQTISLVLAKPAAYFLEALAYSTGDVVEEKLITQYGATWIDHLPSGGTSGPFKVQSYGHTTSLVLVPDPNYFGFKPKLQKIIFTIASDRDSNYKAYQGNQYDIASIPPALQPAALQDAAHKKVNVEQEPALASRFIMMNYLVKPLDNIHIRQGLDLAINKDLIINHVIGPKIVTPSNHIVPDGIPGYNAKLTGPDGVAGTTGDQDKAKQLFQQGLQEAGYSSVSQFPSLTIAYDNSYKAGADTITAIVAQWKSVLGVTIKPVGVPPNQQFEDATNTIGHQGPMQLSYLNWGADYPDPQDWVSNFFGQGGQDNFSNYGQNNSAAAAEQQAVQAELTKADTDQNKAERLQLYQDAEQKIVNDVGWIVTYQSSYGLSLNIKLQGFHINSLGAIATSDWANVYFVK